MSTITMQKTVGFILIVSGIFLMGFYFGQFTTQRSERMKAIHENAAEYYINLNTLEREFRYHQPIAAPTPFGKLEANIVNPFERPQ